MDVHSATGRGGRGGARVVLPPSAASDLSNLKFTNNYKTDVLFRGQKNVTLITLIQKLRFF